MRSIEERWRARDASGRRNNFDALRLFAASIVLISHSLQIGNKNNEGINTMGTIGVLIFFSISGFLIAKSWVAHPDARAFVAARSLRILPALVVNVLVLALIVGPIVTTAPLGDYFSDPQFFAFLANGLLINETGGLPGVFPASVFPGSMNLPYWTLAYEAACYALVMALGRAGILDLRGLGMALVLLLAIMMSPRLIDGELGDFLDHWSALAPAFVTGAIAAVFSARIPASAVLAVGSFLAILLAINTDYGLGVILIFGTYIVMCIAFAPLPRFWNAAKYGDLSYGLYIWGWPVQQTIHMAAPDIGGLGNLALAFPLTAGLAFLSWRYVEKPALALKGRFRKAATAPASAAPSGETRLSSGRLVAFAGRFGAKGRR